MSEFDDVTKPDNLHPIEAMARDVTEIRQSVDDLSKQVDTGHEIVVAALTNLADELVSVHETLRKLSAKSEEHERELASRRPLNGGPEHAHDQ